MTDGKDAAAGLNMLDSLNVDVLTDDVSDNYVGKTLFAVSEFSNVVLGGANVISGEALLCANLGFGLRLVSNIGGEQHTLLFDTGPEGAIFLRNCANLGIRLGEVEAIAITHGHWDHMAALPMTIDKIFGEGGRVTVHVNPGMFNERAIRLSSGRVVPVAKVPHPAELEQRGATVGNSPEERLLLDGHFYNSGEIPRVSSLRRDALIIYAERAPRRLGNRTLCYWTSGCSWRRFTAWVLLCSALAPTPVSSMCACM